MSRGQLTLPNKKIIHPLAFDDEDYDWLELGNINIHKIENPLKYTEFKDDPAIAMVKTFCNDDYLHFACKHLLNVELLPFQVCILDTLWRKKLPMLIATRGLGKSFILAVYSLLRMIFDPGCKIVIVGAGFRQARQVMGYMDDIWNNSPVLRDIVGSGKNAGPKREIDRVEFRIGRSITIGIPIGNGDKIRGLRANYILADEFSVIDPEIFNIVVRGFGIVSGNPVQKVKESMAIDRLKKAGEWTKELEALRKNGIGGNQIVFSGTAYYEFNHFCEYWKKWKLIIESKGNPKVIKALLGEDNLIEEGFDWKDYAILRIPYTHVPSAFLDKTMLAQSKATLTNSQFMMEYAAVFVQDSDGFFKRSVLESCTTTKPVITTTGQKIQFAIQRQGKSDKKYVIGVDPARSSDNAAIVVLEVNNDHRKVVYCWSVNRKKFTDLRKKNLVKQDDYYKFLGRKIRDLMKLFNTDAIIMDSNGGGTAIAEVLGDPVNCEIGELPIYQFVDPDKPKDDDMKDGLHILELVIPTNDYNSEANHSMLKDFETKSILFPAFDVIELAKYIEIDRANDISIDTYEDLVDEIEELKNEITTIVCTPTPTGKEHFDTPEVKTLENKKGRLRKDRYSAILYANYYARGINSASSATIEYKAVGGSNKETRSIARAGDTKSMYNFIKPTHIKTNDWVSNPKFRHVKH